jgi:hypothetical protein
MAALYVGFHLPWCTCKTDHPPWASDIDIDAGRLTCRTAPWMSVNLFDPGSDPTLGHPPDTSPRSWWGSAVPADEPLQLLGTKHISFTFRDLRCRLETGCRPTTHQTRHFNLLCLAISDFTCLRPRFFANLALEDTTIIARQDISSLYALLTARFSGSVARLVLSIPSAVMPS